MNLENHLCKMYLFDLMRHFIVDDGRLTLDLNLQPLLLDVDHQVPASEGHGKGHPNLKLLQGLSPRVFVQVGSVARVGFYLSLVSFVFFIFFVSVAI